MVAHGVLYWWQRRDASQRFLWHVANLLTRCEMSGSCTNSPLEFHQLPICASSLQEMIWILLKGKIYSATLLPGNSRFKLLLTLVTICTESNTFHSLMLSLWESKLTISRTMPRVLLREWLGRGMKSGWEQNFADSGCPWHEKWVAGPQNGREG